MIAMAKNGADRAKDAGEPTSVGITIGARDALSAYCDTRHGMTLRDVLTSVVTWFVRQPTVVKQVVLGETGEEPEVRKAYAAALRRLAEDVERKGLALGKYAVWMDDPNSLSQQTAGEQAEGTEDKGSEKPDGPDRQPEIPGRSKGRRR